MNDIQKKACMVCMACGGTGGDSIYEGIERGWVPVTCVDCRGTGIYNRPTPLTNDEIKTIASFKRLAKRWPKTLWVFGGGEGGPLAILKLNEKGERVYRSSCVDQNFIVDYVDIPHDGGGW